MASSNVYAGIAGYVGRPDAVGAVGVFRRPVGSSQWEHVLSDHEAFAVFVHPADPNLVFAGTPDGVYRSTDRGVTFQRTSFPDKNVQVWSFLAADTNPDLMYAGASPISVYRSDDRGASWRRLPTPSIPERCVGPFAPRVMRMVQRPGNPLEIYAALEIAGAMRTTDGGESWQDLGDDLVRLSERPNLRSAIVQKHTNAEGMLDGHAITISPANPDEPIIALRMGLFRAKDHGKTWEDLEVNRFSPTTYGRDIKVAPQNPKTLYAALSVAAASHDGGLYRSDDAGANWRRFDRVQVHGTIMSIGLHRSDPDQVYIGARYNGEIFGTEDGGKTWKDLSIPGPVKDIYSIACG
jgi:photosystem II stability/assembly factor-like uncharacterized protein